MWFVARSRRRSSIFGVKGGDALHGNDEEQCQKPTTQSRTSPILPEKSEARKPRILPANLTRAARRPRRDDTTRRSTTTRRTPRPSCSCLQPRDDTPVRLQPRHRRHRARHTAPRSLLRRLPCVHRRPCEPEVWILFPPATSISQPLAPLTLPQLPQRKIAFEESVLQPQRRFSCSLNAAAMTTTCTDPGRLAASTPTPRPLRRFDGPLLGHLRTPRAASSGLLSQPC